MLFKYYISLNVFFFLPDILFSSLLVIVPVSSHLVINTGDY